MVVVVVVVVVIEAGVAVLLVAVGAAAASSSSTTLPGQPRVSPCQQSRNNPHDHNGPNNPIPGTRIWY